MLLLVSLVMSININRYIDDEIFTTNEKTVEIGDTAFETTDWTTET